jgi:KDO2-lipid IV(A) lauroyltransferase
MRAAADRTPTGRGTTSRRRETPKEWASYHAYAGLERLARTLPEPVGRRAFRALGRLAHAALPGVRETVRRNMGQVLGLPPDHPLVAATARDAFDLYARYWHEAFRAATIPREELERRFRVEGLERLDEALAAGRGVVGVMPHMGNWDVAGRWLALHGYRVVAVAERLRPERLFRLFLRHRERIGLRILPLERGARVTEQLQAFLRDNWIVGLVADRDLTGRGIEVEMFGAPRRLPAGPATLALTTGAPLVVCAATSDPDGWTLRVGRPIEVPRSGNQREDVRALTARMGERFERLIAANPADWHMFQPAWPR